MTTKKNTKSNSQLANNFDKEYFLSTSKDAKIKYNSVDQYNMGLRYFYGDNSYMGKSPLLALKWFKRAAANEFAPAYKFIGMHYFNEFNSDKKAFYWYNKYVSNDKNADPIDKAILGYLYLKLTKTPEIAVKLFKRSIKCKESQYLLAICYINGYGVNTDQTTGMKLLKKILPIEKIPIISDLSKLEFKQFV